MKIQLLLLLLVSITAVDRANASEPALPSIPDKIFKITDHGGVGDDTTDNAKAIQATIDAASSAGGGVVEIPAGNFLSGPIRLADHIRLQIDEGATLRMLPITRYPGGSHNPANFISGSK